MKSQNFDQETGWSDFQEENMYIKVSLLINAIHHEDISHEVSARKEEIFALIQQKIKQYERKVIPIKFVKKWILTGAIAFVLFGVGIGYSSYRHGYSSGRIEATPANIVVKTPMGTNAEVILPDSSIVSLNAMSSLTYPSYFQKERVVTIEGEGFFRIQKNKYPFIVQTNNLSIKALGTSFNVWAYQNDDQTLVTLKDGIVEVFTDINNNESLQLRPNQQFIINHATGEIKRQSVKVDDFTAWQNGNLVYKDVPLSSIAKSLERRFNVRINIIDPDLNNEHYYASFGHHENLEKILSLLSYKRKWTYKKHGESIDIQKKSNHNVSLKNVKL